MKPNSIKKVLIALDYDPAAEKVAESGYTLARSAGASIILLNVISDQLQSVQHEHITVMGFSHSPEPGPAKLPDREALKIISQLFLEKAKSHLGDKDIVTISLEGDYADTILACAKKNNADFIVMGTHSRRWMKNIIMGNVTKQLLQKTTIPVYIIPTKKNALK